MREEGGETVVVSWRKRRECGGEMRLAKSCEM